METKEIVKEITVDVLKRYDKHNDRVLKAIGKIEPDTRPISNQIEKLKNRGFQVFVDKDIQDQFKYVAGIQGSYVIDREPSTKIITTVSVLSIIIFLSPILPALLSNNLLLLFFLFLSGFISMLAISIGLTPSVVEVNYVGDIPEYVLDNMDKAKECDIDTFRVYSAQPLPTEEVLVKTDPVMIGWLDDRKTGVIIGIWDRDKEITI
jgi:hypothetical protein